MGKHVTDAQRLKNKRQAAEYLGDISTRTLDRLIDQGVLPTVRFHAQGDSGRVFLDVRDLDKFIEASKVHKSA